jgi:phage protein U
MTLMALGPVAFEIYPLNPQATDRSTEASWVEKPVVGRRPPLEFTGDGSEEMAISAKLFPAKFGGLSALAALDAMRASATPHFLVRGDGTPLGWFCVVSVKEKSTYLNAAGVGQIIDVDLNLKRADAPGASGYMAALMSLL